MLDAAALSVLALDHAYEGQALHILGRERIATMQVMQMISEMIGGDSEIHLRDEPL